MSALWKMKRALCVLWEGLFALLSFLLLFLLDRQGIGRDTVLWFGALGYSVCSVAAPALTYYLDRKA